MFYRVSPNPELPSHHDYGYEDKYEFFKAVRQLANKYGGRVGECIGTRHAFLLLSFAAHDGRPAKAWLPVFMCELAAPPASNDDEEQDPLDGLLGEGW